MNRLLLMLLLALDLLVLGSSVFILWDRIRKNFSAAPVVYAKTAPPPAQPAQAPLETPPAAAEITHSTAPAQPERKLKKYPGPPRRVFFRYRDSVPKRVVIVGDFNGWSPQLMKKDASHNWTVALKLSPGEYAYNFIVDGRLIRDPSNKKTIHAGQKIPSSLLNLKPK